MTDTVLEMTSDSTAAQNNERLEAIRLYLITDRTLLPEDQFLTGIEAALRGGVRAIQLREKNLPENELRDLAQDVLQLTQKYNALLFINHRAELAHDLGADGVHLTESSTAVKHVRKQYPDLLIGSSQGLEKLQQVCAGIDIPVLALGGIDLPRTSTVRKHGAFGVGLIRGIWNSPDIEHESLQYINALTGETP